MNLSELDVVILCGGLGTRFREVDPEIPKVMAPVAGRPFLDWVIASFRKQGCKRFIFCTGYKSEVIEKYLQSSLYSIQMEIVISEEMQPLGTAGAVKRAEPSIRSEPFLVVNGDSYCTIDLAAFVEFHAQHNASISIALAPEDIRKDTGSVVIDEHTFAITAFKEKEEVLERRYVNAGIYFFQKIAIAHCFAGRRMSLEYDLFPAFIGQGLYGFVSPEKVWDIGTPERYREACAHFTHMK